MFEENGGNCFKRSKKHSGKARSPLLHHYEWHQSIVFSLILQILTGEGKLVVLVVGDYSCIGKISALLRQSEPEATPLQMKLEKIARDIGNFGLYSAIVIVLVMFTRFTIERISAQDSDPWDNSRHWQEMLNFFIIGITVVVVAIPEGLPLAVTLSLAYSVKKMLADKNLVRKL